MFHRRPGVGNARSVRRAASLIVFRVAEREVEKEQVVVIVVLDATKG
jgi:hypothetical protein